MEEGLVLIALLMEKPHVSIDLGFCSPWRTAGDSSNGGGRGEGSWLPGDRAGTFSILIILPGAHLLWRGHSETGVLVLAPLLSVCVSSLLWASIFPFGNRGQVEEVVMSQGVENGTAPGCLLLFCFVFLP